MYQNFDLQNMVIIGSIWWTYLSVEVQIQLYSKICMRLENKIYLIKLQHDWDHTVWYCSGIMTDICQKSVFLRASFQFITLSVLPHYQPYPTAPVQPSHNWTIADRSVVSYGQTKETAVHKKQTEQKRNTVKY